MTLHVPDKPIEPEHGGVDYKHEFEAAGPSTVVCSRCRKERDADDCDYDGVCLVCLGEKEEFPGNGSEIPHKTRATDAVSGGLPEANSIGVSTNGSKIETQAATKLSPATTLQETSMQEIVGIVSVLKQIKRRFGINE